jgi:hypothetical protein
MRREDLMTNTLLRSVVGTGLLLSGLTTAAVVAQDRDRDRDDSYYSRREAFFHDEHWRARLFQRVRDDLNEVQSSTFPVSRDELRIVRTKEELGQLQEKLADHRYDAGQLDEVIAGVQRVIDSNRLSNRDRDMLSDDVARMREYRDHHDNWDRP